MSLSVPRQEEYWRYSSYPTSGSELQAGIGEVDALGYDVGVSLLSSAAQDELGKTHFASGVPGPARSSRFMKMLTPWVFERFVTLWNGVG